MSGAAVQISDQFVSQKARRVSSKQAWARYVRNRWPENAVAHAQREWDLTPAQARGLVYAHASQPTIDTILTHKRGGPVLALRVEACAWGLELETFLHTVVAHERRRLADVRDRIEETDTRLAALSGGVPALGSISGRVGSGRTHLARVETVRDMGRGPGSSDQSSDY